MTNKEAEELKFLSTEEVRQIAQQLGTPTFIYNEKAILESLEYMKNLPNEYGLTVRYSMKGQANSYILKLINSCSVSFDASSRWEAQRAIMAGVDPKKSY